MERSLKATGLGCKFIGSWLLATSALLVYAETAPTIAEPDFRWALACLIAGLGLFYTGCVCNARQGTSRHSD